jgi:hypothetical protein
MKINSLDRPRTNDGSPDVAHWLGDRDVTVAGCNRCVVTDDESCAGSQLA